MKVLFLTTNGIEDASFGGAKASIRNYRAINNIADVADVYHIKKKSRIKSLFSLFQLRFPPLLISDEKKVKQLIQEKKYNVVFCDFSGLGTLAKLAKKNGCFVIVFFHNCEVDYIDVRFGNGKSIKKYIYKTLIKKYERMSVKYSDYKVVFTGRDYKRISGLYETKINAIIPIGMNDIYDAQKIKNIIPKYCLLLGPAETANCEGFLWFTKNVSPYLDCKTLIVGKGFEKLKDKLSTDKVEVIGYIDDISIAYGGAVCVAVPLFSGGGMKIKTAEALMFGKYIFGTDEAFVGYDMDFSMVGGICNKAGDFINGINKLLNKGNFFNHYSREVFETRYSISSSNKEFKKIQYYFEKEWVK